MKKRIIWALFFVFTIFPLYQIKAATNAGFVQANIWYSKDPFEEGDKIKIYTFVFNPDSRELSGTVIFFDKNVMIGKKNFIAPPRSVKDISIDWTAGVGDHTIFAKIEGAKFLLSTGEYEETYIAESQTSNSDRSVSKKIIPKVEDTTKNTGPKTSTPDQIQNIENFVTDKTPAIISKPIVATANIIDSQREQIGNISTKEKENIKNEINKLNQPNSTAKSTKPSENPNPVLKPWKYVELFFFTLLSFIFNNKLIFYGVFILFSYFIFRFIWRIIF